MTQFVSQRPKWNPSVPSSSSLELLAPAGDRAALLAALSAGADAVYLGVESFNARRKAANFTLSSLPEACDLAHLAGAQVYLTLNTAILPDEAEAALNVASEAWLAGIDAAIVQDLGLLRRLRAELPELRLHASTQMNIHNSEAVLEAAELGAARVTLARELALSEIAQIGEAVRIGQAVRTGEAGETGEAGQTGIELEAFAHGALCVCYSGLCLFSSLVGRRSANRGLCAQACRLPYQLIDTSTGRAAQTAGKHLLSPRDLSTLEILPQLAKSGLRSLKIEGRMKSAAYVYQVTRAYREALDALAGDGGRAAGNGGGAEGAAAGAAGNGNAWGGSAGDVGAGNGNTADGTGGNPAGAPSSPSRRQDELAEVFSRGFTTAYLEGERGNAMMSYQRPNNQGSAIGRVSGLGDGLVSMRLDRPVVAGDLLEVRTSRGAVSVEVPEGTAADAPAGAQGGAGAEAEGGTIRLKVSRPVGLGDRVFRVRSAALLNEAAENFSDALFVGNSGLVPLHARVELRLGAPARVGFSTLGRPFKGGEGPAAEPADQPATGDAAGTGDAGSTGDAVGAGDAGGTGDAALASTDGQAAAASRPTGLSPDDPAGVAWATGPVVAPARSRALDEASVREHVGRVGQTPFYIDSWEIAMDEGVGLGFSELHRLRSEALEELQAGLLEPWHDRAQQSGRPAAGKRRTAVGRAYAPARPGQPQLAVLVRDEAAARLAFKAGAHRVYLQGLQLSADDQAGAAGAAGASGASGAEAAAGAGAAGAGAAGVGAAGASRAEAAAGAGAAGGGNAASGGNASGSGGNAASGNASSGNSRAAKPKPGRRPGLWLPAVTHDRESAWLDRQLAADTIVVANNIGQLRLCQQRGRHAPEEPSQGFEAGPALGIYNLDALRLLKDAGAERAWLSPELTLAQISEVSAETPITLGLTVFGQQELMVTEHCILMAQGPCDQRCESCARRKSPRLLRDEKGYEFSVKTDQFGRSHLYNSYALDLVPLLPQLVTAGLNSFLVDATLLNNRDLSAEVARAAHGLDLALHKNGSLPKREGYTTGHLFRGVF